MMNQITHPLRLLIAVICAATLSACSSVSSSMGDALNLDTDVELVFQVDADINPDDAGTPSPLYIRMYELRDTKMLNKAAFIDLYEDDAAALGNDLVKKHNLKLFTPGQDRGDYFVLNEETTHVGLFAEFLQYKDAEFKVIAPVVSSNLLKHAVRIHIEGNKLYIKDDTKKSNALDCEGRLCKKVNEIK